MFKYRFDTNVNNDELKTFFYEVNNKICIPEPLPKLETKEIWKNALKYSEENCFDSDYNNNNGNNENNKNNNNKTSILKQLKPEIREQLLKHVCWDIISYSPLKFLIASFNHRQIIYAEVKKYKKTITKNNDNDAASST